MKTARSFWFLLLILVLALAVPVFASASGTAGEILITRIDLTIIEPELNEAADRNPTISTNIDTADAAGILGVDWYRIPADSTDEYTDYSVLPSGEYFTRGYSYQAQITVSANSGYRFADDAAFYVNSSFCEAVHTVSTLQHKVVILRFAPFANPTVTFDANGGTVTPTSVITNSEGKLPLSAMPVPTRQDCVFKGWYIGHPSSETAATLNTKFNTDNTVYARWEGPYIPSVAVTMDEPVIGEPLPRAASFETPYGDVIDKNNYHIEWGKMPKNKYKPTMTINDLLSLYNEGLYTEVFATELCEPDYVYVAIITFHLDNNSYNKGVRLAQMLHSTVNGIYEPYLFVPGESIKTNVAVYVWPKPSAPATGDNMQPLTVLLLMLLSAGCAAVLVVRYRKSRKA